jgi:hypothetical protein
MYYPFQNITSQGHSQCHTGLASLPSFLHCTVLFPHHLLLLRILVHVQHFHRVYSFRPLQVPLHILLLFREIRHVQRNIV